jgi:hypothetical protein
MKLYLVINKCGEGAAFNKKADARACISGRFNGLAHSALAEAFHELYEDDNRLVEIEIDDKAD